MSDPNNVDMLNKYLRRIYTVLADSFKVDVRKLNLSEVSQFATDYLRKDTMPSTCALDYYNKYIAKSTEDLRYSNDEGYDKFLHEIADCLEAEYHIDKRKLAEFTSFPQKCWKHYNEKSDAHWTAIDFYNSCSGDEIEYMLLKLLEYSHDDGYNRFLNKVADLLERKCSIDKTKLPISDFCRSCLPMYKNSKSVLDVFKFYKARLEGETEEVQALRKLKPKKTEKAMATTRGKSKTKDADNTCPYIDFDESDGLNQYLNDVLDELVKHESIDKQAFAKESARVDHFIEYCRDWWYQDKDPIDCAQDYYGSLSKGYKDALPKLNTQTTDEKETKTMATDNQNANAQNVPTVAPIKKIDAVGMMKVKMAETMFKKDGEIDYSKLMMMDAIGDDGKVNLNKVIEAKMNGKIMKAIESGEDIPLDKLMIFQAMQGGQIDYNQIYMYKIIGQMLDDDDKKADGKKAETK
jgi:hypothetical protein